MQTVLFHIVEILSQQNSDVQSLVLFFKFNIIRKKKLISIIIMIIIMMTRRRTTMIKRKPRLFTRTHAMRMTLLLE